MLEAPKNVHYLVSKWKKRLNEVGGGRNDGSRTIQCEFMFFFSISISYDVLTLFFYFIRISDIFTFLLIFFLVNFNSLIFFLWFLIFTLFKYLIYFSPFFHLLHLLEYFKFLKRDTSRILGWSSLEQLNHPMSTLRILFGFVDRIVNDRINDPFWSCFTNFYWLNQLMIKIVSLKNDLYNLKNLWNNKSTD